MIVSIGQWRFPLEVYRGRLCTVYADTLDVETKEKSAWTGIIEASPSVGNRKGISVEAREGRSRGAHLVSHVLKPMSN